MAGRPVHLVGSIPLADAGAVFRAAGQRLGHRLARIPDGETGICANWIAWQQPVFAAQAALTASPARERDYQLRPPYRFAPGGARPSASSPASESAPNAASDDAIRRRFWTCSTCIAPSPINPGNVTGAARAKCGRYLHDRLPSG